VTAHHPSSLRSKAFLCLDFVLACAYLGFAWLVLSIAPPLAIIVLLYGLLSFLSPRMVRFVLAIIPLLLFVNVALWVTTSAADCYPSCGVRDRAIRTLLWPLFLGLLGGLAYELRQVLHVFRRRAGRVERT
jgi:hypothetical protein